MKKSLVITVILTVLLICLAGAFPAFAQSPLPTPTPEEGVLPVTSEPEEVSGPEDPTNLSNVLTWLAGGGAGAFVAVWIEKRKWFQAIPSSYKPLVVLGVITLVALIPQLLLDFVSPEVWEVLGPYFTTIMTAVLAGYPLSQLFHAELHKA